MEGEEEVKIKLSFLTATTTIQDRVDVSWGGFFAMKLQSWVMESLPTVPFALLSFPLPTMIFSRGFYIYIRNEIQFPELEIFCYFFFFFLT